MKKGLLPLIGLMLLSLCACDFSFTDIFSSSSANSSVSSSVSSNSISSKEVSSLSAENSISVAGKKGKVELYALNDFHGSCDVKSDEAGIVKVGSFFKEKGKEKNTLLLNSGDMFQGSLVSNENRGQFLTEVMNDVQFDAFTLGNHEFDWGQEYIKKNEELKDKNTGYSTPFLASNVYKYDIDRDEVGSYADLGKQYVTYTLENGIKVGIIGCIGEKQITSITSSYVDDLTFLDPVEVTAELSDKLRTEEKCDVVILDCHADQDDLLNRNLTSISKVSKKRYVDAVFCAHSHHREKTMENGVPFVQGSCNGKAYSYISLKVDGKGNVTCSDFDYPCTSSINVKPDKNIADMYSYYTSLYNGSEVIGNLKGSLNKSGGNNYTVANFVTEAIAYAAKHYGNNYDISYALCNTSRDTLTSGNITLNDLFKALPFENEVYIIKTKGSALRKELRYNDFYRLDEEPLDDYKTYTIAVIDYLALHRNALRRYDYFPRSTKIGKITKNGEEYKYRDITKDYIKLLGNVNAYDYSSSKMRHNAGYLDNSI